MSRSLRDARVRNVLGVLTMWKLSDGKTLDCTVADSLVEAMDLGMQRVGVVQAVAEAYLRVCPEHALDRLDAWANSERELKERLEREADARDALVALGMKLADADTMVDAITRKVREAKDEQSAEAVH